jgi:DNA-binding transcriptional ArsR family regulator
MSQDFCDSKHIHTEAIQAAAKAMPSPEALEAAVVLFEALSDPSRILILLGMQNVPELCVCDVAALLDTSVASASHHLRKMKDVGILKRRNEGKLVFYSLKSTRVEAILRAALSAG